MSKSNPILAWDTFDGLLCPRCACFAGSDCDGPDGPDLVPIRARDFEQGYYDARATCDYCERVIFPENVTE
jgi:hypothetical protein